MGGLFISVYGVLAGIIGIASAREMMQRERGCKESPSDLHRDTTLAPLFLGFTFYVGEHSGSSCAWGGIKIVDF